MTIHSRKKEIFKQYFAITNRQIGNLVYELYNLTEDEIKIVKGT